MKNEKLKSRLVRELAKLIDRLPENFPEMLDSSGRLDLVLALHFYDDACTRSCVEEFSAETAFDNKGEIRTKFSARTRMFYRDKLYHEEARSEIIDLEEVLDPPFVENQTNE